MTVSNSFDFNAFQSPEHALIDCLLRRDAGATTETLPKCKHLNVWIDGRTPLIVAIVAAPKNDASLVKMLLDAGADPNMPASARYDAEKDRAKAAEYEVERLLNNPTGRA